MAKNLRERYGPWALIAGASEGIGYSFAEQLAEAGINLLLLARREAPLEQAAATLREQHGVEVRTAAFDLAGSDIESRLDALVDGLEVGLLVYNAGATHGAGFFLDEPLAKAQSLVALNCHGPLLFCHALGRGMRERSRGGIILLGSLSGLVGGGYIAAYCATKSFDITLAEALWAELKPHNVDVMALIAGATVTPAMLGSGVSFDPAGPNPPMQPEQVAREGLEKLGEVPVWIAGENNRAAAATLRSVDREQPIEMMTSGAAVLYDKPYPLC